MSNARAVEIIDELLAETKKRDLFSKREFVDRLLDIRNEITEVSELEKLFDASQD